MSDGTSQFALRLSLLRKYVNERFLGIHIELGNVTSYGLNIGSESLRQDENECSDQQ